ncbi:MAG TPA: response regulator [Thermoanaerobaculia bacterium]|nr:response regulator [Thermoanaerobaculia bacterium]
MTATVLHIPPTQPADSALDRVLLVDDDEETLTILAVLIRRLHCHVDSVTSIEAAEKLLDAGRYDLVITDLRLTGVLGEEGLEILQYVKEKSPKTRVILVTGFGNPQLMSRAYRLGAACYFEKPVDPARLFAAIQQLKS